ncbi:hypothetical protein V5O48_015363 [Marasmius crinis-equi]|uniref:Uncharacterized protein n=1 Tax=Marasmius crinis-equi TaxID=585013 RepID=A0ABR3EUR2_9AGAR
MPPGKPSPFTPEQDKILDSYEAPMARLLQQHNLHMGKTTCSSDPEPGKLDYTARSPEQWGNAVANRLKNVRNNKIIKGNLKTAIATVQVANAAANNNTTSSLKPNLTSGKSLDVVRELLKIHTLKTGKEIFEREMSDDIKARAAQKRSETLILNPGAAYQLALSESWAKADKDAFEARVEKNSVGDMFENQSELSRLFYSALTAVCESGYFGPCEMVLLVGFRDRDNKPVAEHVDASFEPDMNDIFLRDDQKLTEQLNDAWCDYINTQIPMHVSPSDDNGDMREEETPRNAAGVPIFPEVDVDKITFDAFKRTYAKWLQMLWEYSWPKDSRMPALPTADLQSHPHLFYNTDQYKFPVPLTSADLVQRNTMFDLLGYLKSVSNGHVGAPFVFRTKAIAIQGLTSTQARVEDDRQAGDEIDMGAFSDVNKTTGGVDEHGGKNEQKDEGRDEGKDEAKDRAKDERKDRHCKDSVGTEGGDVGDGLAVAGGTQEQPSDAAALDLGLPEPDKPVDALDADVPKLDKPDEPMEDPVAPGGEPDQNAPGSMEDPLDSPEETHPLPSVAPQNKKRKRAAIERSGPEEPQPRRSSRDTGILIEQSLEPRRIVRNTKPGPQAPEPGFTSKRRKGAKAGKGGK